MAGIEPASERFVPRTSTSVVVCGLSPEGLQATKGNLQPSAEARKPLFHTLSGICVWHSGFCVAQTHPRPECGDGWTRPTFGALCALSSYTRQRGGEQHRSQCGWHLIGCADFPRSAPLDSQFGTSLLRRSQSSPRAIIIPLRHRRGAAPRRARRSTGGPGALARGPGPAWIHHWRGW
jgi:hypothetical protein